MFFCGGDATQRLLIYSSESSTIVAFEVAFEVIFEVIFEVAFEVAFEEDEEEERKATERKRK